MPLPILKEEGNAKWNEKKHLLSVKLEVDRKALEERD